MYIISFILVFVLTCIILTLYIFIKKWSWKRRGFPEEKRKEIDIDLEILNDESIEYYATHEYKKNDS